jgi:hypothetical protein
MTPVFVAPASRRQFYNLTRVQKYAGEMPALQKTESQTTEVRLQFHLPARMDYWEQARLAAQDYSDHSEGSDYWGR